MTNQTPNFRLEDIEPIKTTKPVIHRTFKLEFDKSLYADRTFDECRNDCYHFEPFMKCNHH